VTTYEHVTAARMLARLNPAAVRWLSLSSLQAFQPGWIFIGVKIGDTIPNTEYGVIKASDVGAQDE
jgi:hypothetical protein